MVNVTELPLLNSDSTKATFKKREEVRKYEIELYKFLSRIREFRKFKSCIVEELFELGFGHWAYSQLDLPDSLTVSEHLGTINEELLDIYMHEAYYECDLTLQHANRSDRPVFQSDIESFIKSSPVETESLKRCTSLLKLNKNFGYTDYYSIPLKSQGKNDSRTLFTVTTTNKDSGDFRSRVIRNAGKLHALGRIINDLGLLNFPGIFTGSKNKYEKFIKSQPFNLLVTMAKHDLPLNMAADRLGISLSTAEKHIQNIRQSLGAKTNYGAYEIALKRGFVV